MKTKMHLTLLAFSLLPSVFCLAAQPLGTAFTYQGQLAERGQSASGSYDFKFTLYDASVGGSPWHLVVTNLNLAVTNGLFTTPIDFGLGPFDGTARWLQMGVRTNGQGGDFTGLSPRQPLTPTPYASYAPNAAAAGTASSVAPGSVTGAGIASGQVVRSINGQTDTVLLPTNFWSLLGNAGTAPGTHFLGTTDDQPLELQVNGARALRLQPRTGGAPNLIAGHPFNSIAADSTGSAIGGGGNKFVPNTITANTAVVAGGRGNVIEGDDSAILGGVGNAIRATSSQSVIGGGENNVIEHDSLRATIGGGSLNCIHTFGSDSTISGGTGHTNFAFNATIGGGTWNRTYIDAQQATIAGGMGNAIGGFAGAIGGGGNNAIGSNFRFATVAGGQSNSCTATFAAVGGGVQHTNKGYAATVAGGFRNVCGSDYAFVGGGLTNSATGSRSTVGGGEGNQSVGLCTTVGGGIRNRSVNTSATVAGGTQNTAHGPNASVGGGYENMAGGEYAAVGGGYQNTNNGHASVLGGGSQNQVQSGFSTVSGGWRNTAEGEFSTVAGGDDNHATGAEAVVGGGFGNTASGDQATVPGGFLCSATQKGSFAAGWRGHATHEGSFVLADRNDNDLYSDDVNQFTGRFTGGVRFWSSLVGGVRLLPGATSWSVLCDRNLKENLQSVDGQEVLRRLAAMPMQTWNLTTQNPSIRHLGPMAQDFAAAFQLGETNTCINTIDADGVALAAIQGLNQKVEAGSQKLESENTALKKEVAELKALVKELAAKVSGRGR